MGLTLVSPELNLRASKSGPVDDVKCIIYLLAKGDSRLYMENLVRQLKPLKRCCGLRRGVI